MSVDNQNIINWPPRWPVQEKTRRAGARSAAPHIFSCTGLWQHDQPLLTVLQSRYGHRRLDSLGGSYGWSVRYKQVEDYEAIGLTTLGEYIDAYRAGSMSLPYLRHMSLNKAFPELRKLILDPARFRPNWVTHPTFDRLGGPELFIGQSGTAFGNVHQDQVGVHVGFVQLEGSKEIIVYPPADAPYLYTIEGRQFPFELRNSAVGYRDLENYADYPLLRKASPQRIVLTAGQAMFLPSDWWHTTRNLTDSVSYNVRIVNGSNIGRCIGRHIAGIPRAIRRFNRRRNTGDLNT